MLVMENDDLIANISLLELEASGRTHINAVLGQCDVREVGTAAHHFPSERHGVSSNLET